MSELMASSTEADHRKLRWLWIGLVLYFFLMLYASRYVSGVPYQVLVLGGILNMAIIISFVVALRGAYRRRGANAESKDATGAKARSTREADLRRIRMLWIGLGMYFLIMLNAFRYVHRVPYQALIAGFLINGAIIVTIIVVMRRVYKRLAQ